MKLTIDLDETWSYEESIAEAIQETIKTAIGNEVRKIAREAVSDNKTAIIAVANAYASRMVEEARKALL